MNKILVISIIALLVSCKPVYEIDLNRYSYGDFDYEVFLEGDWARDSLQTNFLIKGKRGKSILTGFEVNPELIVLYHSADGSLIRTTYNTEILVSTDKPVKLVIKYTPQFQQIFPCTLSFFLNHEKISVRIEPTNLFVNDSILKSNGIVELSKSMCSKICILSFSFKSFDSVYVYNSAGNIVLQKVFEESYSGLDVSNLSIGEYLVQLNGQHKPNYFTLKIKK